LLVEANRGRSYPMHRTKLLLLSVEVAALAVTSLAAA
jgi:hypothetical protein